MEYIELRGKDAEPYLNEIALLRIKVFSEWPYLYDGDVGYEKKYLTGYFKSKNSFIVLAKDDAGKIVGASTAILLSDSEIEFQKPFLEKNYNLKSVCYYGESVLLPGFRGQGTGKAFMNRREKFARSFPGVSYSAFCAVVRPKDHPKRDLNYRSLEPFWKSLGFSPVDGMYAHFSWKELGGTEEVRNTLQFWVKNLK